MVIFWTQHVLGLKVTNPCKYCIAVRRYTCACLSHANEKWCTGPSTHEGDYVISRDVSVVLSVLGGSPCPLITWTRGRIVEYLINGRTGGCYGVLQDRGYHGWRSTCSRFVSFRNPACLVPIAKPCHIHGAADWEWVLGGCSFFAYVCVSGAHDYFIGPAAIFWSLLSSALGTQTTRVVTLVLGRQSS